eukprot:TCALIF_06669-PA protein Name:"Protein of unknown function" AED:0.45 eAED:0.61 QI:131/0/0.5/1/0/0.5/2/0/42
MTLAPHSRKKICYYYDTALTKLGQGNTVEEFRLFLKEISLSI